MMKTEVISVGLFILFLVQLSSSSTLVKPEHDVEKSKNSTAEVTSSQETKKTEGVIGEGFRKDLRSFTSEISDAVEKLKCTFVNCDKKDEKEENAKTDNATTTEPPTTTTGKVDETTTASTTTTTTAPSTDATTTEKPK